jgi:leucyl/phenylalanyl-tRNA--protein transferase
MDDPGQLVGGIYGVAMGGAFFAESMFSSVADASKVCLVHLVEHLRAQHFVLMDVQYSNAQIEQFGVVEIRRAQYLRLLGEAIRREVCW